MSPQRIQMSRKRPWRADHPDAVIVDRRTKWGNPFAVTSCYAPHMPVVGHWHVHMWQERRWLSTSLTKAEAVADAVRRYRLAVEAGWGLVPWPDEIRAELAGRDLACWCPLGSPCHADVLIEAANGGAS